MRRREFIRLVSGAGLTWPLGARAQQSGRVRRVGVLVPGTNGDLDQQSRLRAFEDVLRELGWADGHNLQLDIRYAAGNAEQFQIYATELLAAKPDVLMADTTPSTAALQRETRTVPIVFTAVADPVGQRFVATLAQPGSNITGFTNYEPAMGSKWVDLLKDAVPSIKRITLIYNPQTAPYTHSFLPTFATAARVREITLTNAPVHGPQRTRCFNR